MKTHAFQTFQIVLIKEWKNGIIEGIARGKMEQNCEIAKKMLQEGIDITIIENITGLSKDKILNCNQ